MNERLQILLEAGVIDPEAVAIASEAQQELETRGYAPETLETFLTHLVMAATRILRGEALTEDGSEILRSLLDDPGEETYNRACSLWEALPVHRIGYPPEEMCYLMIHLCALLSGQEKEASSC